MNIGNFYLSRENKAITQLAAEHTDQPKVGRLQLQDIFGQLYDVSLQCNQDT